MAGEEKDAGVRSLIDVNGLAYRMTPGMSVATSRVTREWDALRPSYGTGDVMSFAISSGAAYVDPDNSYIRFTVKLKLAQNAAADAPLNGYEANYYRFFWGDDPKARQTALNCFTDMRLTHSSGYEIDRVNRGFAPYRYLQLAYTKDKEWWDTYGSLMRGYQTWNGNGPQPDAQFWGADGSGSCHPESNYQWSGTNAVASSFNGNQAIAQQENPAYYDQDYSPGLHDRLSVGVGQNEINRILPTARPFGFSGGPAGGSVPVERRIEGEIKIDVCLPLSTISGIWDTDTLSPSFLMAGARLDLTVANVAQVFAARLVATSTIPFPSGIIASVTDPLPTLVTMTLENPKLVLETVTFTDAVLRSISMTSASSGLEIPFVAMHYSQAPFQNDSMSVQINRGLSRANMVIVRPYPQVTQANTAKCFAVDSNKAYWITPSDSGGGFQVKLGAEFMPNKPIDNIIQMFHATQTAFGNWKSERRNTVTIHDYAGAGNSAGTAGRGTGFFPVQACLGCYAMTLEKSSTLAQSGSPISASRDLNVVWGPTSIEAYKGAPWNGLFVDVYVPYITLCTVFLDSVLTRS
jgi:hypothetical protein